MELSFESRMTQVLLLSHTPTQSANYIFTVFELQMRSPLIYSEYLSLLRDKY